MSEITDKKRYEIETNAATFLELRDEIGRTPVSADFVQESLKYPGKYHSVTVVDSSYQYQGTSLISITASEQADGNTLTAMGHYLKGFLKAHEIEPPPRKSHFPTKAGQDYGNAHLYVEFLVDNQSFERARQLTANLLQNGETGLTPEQLASTKPLSKSQYEALLPPEEHNQPRIPHNTAELKQFFASRGISFGTDSEAESEGPSGSRTQAAGPTAADRVTKRNTP